jgi:nitrogen regulatory protein P-II 1
VELLVIVLNKKEQVKPVLRALLDLGVPGATSIQSTGMGRTLADEVPIFGGLRKALNGDTIGSTTIFSVIEDETTVEKAVSTISNLVGGLQKPGTGFLFTVPVNRAVGSSRTSLPRRSRI